MKQIKIKLKSTTPMLMNRQGIRLNTELDKKKGEDYLEHNKRIWREKAHVNDEGQVVIPFTYVKKMLESTQKETACPIVPRNAKRVKSMKQYFKSLVSVDDMPLYKYDGSPVTKDDLTEFWAICTPPGQGSSPNCRPKVNQWQGELLVTIDDQSIREEDILKCIEWGGVGCGFGDWRPENGGNFGRFAVVK